MFIISFQNAQSKRPIEEETEKERGGRRGDKERGGEGERVGERKRDATICKLEQC